MARGILALTESRSWSLYTLSDSRYPLDTRYVGITSDIGKRLREHQKPRRLDTSHRAKWQRSVSRDGGEITLSIVDVYPDSASAESAECAHIEKLRLTGCRLVNGTAGGGGLLNPTPEVRARLSASVSATRTPEFRERLSLIMSEKMTESHRRKLSEAITAGKSSSDAQERDKLAKRMKPPLSSNTGTYKGVSYHKRLGKWCGRIKLDGKDVHLGTFPAPEGAALAYDAAAYAAWGKNCYLNFPAEIAA